MLLLFSAPYNLNQAWWSWSKVRTKKKLLLSIAVCICRIELNISSFFFLLCVMVWQLRVAKQMTGTLAYECRRMYVLTANSLAKITAHSVQNNQLAKGTVKLLHSSMSLCFFSTRNPPETHCFQHECCCYLNALLSIIIYLWYFWNITQTVCRVEQTIIGGARCE